MVHQDGRRRPVVSLVIPTYRRPEALISALAGVASQEVAPDEVLVVRRADDADSASVVASGSAREVVVDRPGVIAAMTAGMRAARGDLIGFLDDDATPHPDWLGRLVAHLADAQVGAAGGRDLITAPSQTATRSDEVGTVTGWGRLIGNHHLATGGQRDVSVLKGANVLFRREALALPDGLRGAGAQVHWEVAMCLWAERRGWRLVFDPAARVDHAVAERFDADRRGRPEPQAVEDAAFNLVAALLGGRPELRTRRALYGLLLGDRAAPGLGRGAVAALSRDRTTLARTWPSLRGQLAALQAEPPVMIPAVSR